MQCIFTYFLAKFNALPSYQFFLKHKYDEFKKEKKPCWDRRRQISQVKQKLIEESKPLHKAYRILQGYISFSKFVFFKSVVFQTFLLINTWYSRCKLVYGI